MKLTAFWLGFNTVCFAVSIDERVRDLLVIADAHVPLLKLNFEDVEFDLTFANGLNAQLELPVQPPNAHQGWGMNPHLRLRPSWQAHMQHDLQAFRSVNGGLHA